MAGTDMHTHLAPGASGKLGDPRQLEAHLDRAGLDRAIVSPPPPYFRQDLDTTESAAWSRDLNDGLLNLIMGRPRLRGLAYLPVSQPAVALAEYGRLDHRWTGVAIPAGGPGPSLADPALDPLWRALDAGSCPVLLHPDTSTDPRLEPYYLSNLLGNPVETGIAVAQLVFGNVLARYPRIRFVLVHCGGVVPAVVGRWTQGVRTARPGTGQVQIAPDVAVRRLWTDCLAYDPAAVDLAVTTFGADRILLGSDWPFPIGAADPRALLAHREADFVRHAATTHADNAFGSPWPPGDA
jgi:aminocarboxymuconate-semialdehyde decarboxylase